MACASALVWQRSRKKAEKTENCNRNQKSIFCRRTWWEWGCSLSKEALVMLWCHSVLTVANFPSACSTIRESTLPWSVISNYLFSQSNCIAVYTLVIAGTVRYAPTTLISFSICRILPSFIKLSWFYYYFEFKQSTFPWNLIHVLAVLTTLMHEGSVFLLL